MESKSDTSSSQKYESGDGDTDWQATLALSYFSENNLPCDAVLGLEDGGTLPVNKETLSKCSEYFRFVWLLIWLIDHVKTGRYRISGHSRPQSKVLSEQCI
jgi:hypothetical protein